MRSQVKTILLSGLVAGILDLLTAIVVYCFILKQVTIIKLLQGIASGIFKTAFSGGILMAVTGVFIHFCIAYTFAAIYFYIFPYSKISKDHKIISGLLYGAVVWLIMNIIVLPIAFHRVPNIHLENLAIGMGILMLMIGLPVSLITHRYYILNKNQAKE